MRRADDVGPPRLADHVDNAEIEPTGSAQPGSDRSPVVRKRGAKHRPVCGDPRPVRPPWRDDDPAGDGLRDPATLLDDLPGETSLPVEGADKLIDVRDVRLQLDDQQRATGGVPGDDVDDASLAVDREGHLRCQLPFREGVSEPGRDGVVERRVPGVEQSIEISCPPASEQVDPHIQRRGHAAQGDQRKRVEMASFDARDGRVRDAGTLRQVPLSPAALVPDDPDRRTKPAVVHARSLAIEAHLTLTGLDRRAGADPRWPNRHPQTLTADDGSESSRRSPETGRNRLPVTISPESGRRPAISVPRCRSCRGVTARLVAGGRAGRSHARKPNTRSVYDAWTRR